MQILIGKRVKPINEQDYGCLKDAYVRCMVNKVYEVVGTSFGMETIIMLTKAELLEQFVYVEEDT